MPYEARSERDLFNTADAFDAGLVGHDGPITAAEGGLSLKMAVDAKRGPVFRLNGPDGEIVLDLAEAQVVADSIATAISKTQARASQLEAA